mmetsp:Transcript_59567/g.66651  ORF Transcript_59567/g.66651 Transcript_59567/m.66651 type:complete len:167 (-) Transcript_59567:112-612(-)
MPTENTSLKIATQDEDSNSAQKMSIDKRSIYQNPFFIIASSLLALLVLVAVTSQSGDQYLTPAEYERQIGERVVAVNIFGNAVSRIRCSQGPNPAPGGVTPAGKSPEYCSRHGHCRTICCNDPSKTSDNCCMCADYCNSTTYCHGEDGSHCTGCPIAAGKVSNPSL